MASQCDQRLFGLISHGEFRHAQHSDERIECVGMRKPAQQLGGGDPYAAVRIREHHLRHQPHKLRLVVVKCAGLHQQIHCLKACAPQRRIRFAHILGMVRRVEDLQERLESIGVPALAKAPSSHAADHLAGVGPHDETQGRHADVTPAVFGVGYALNGPPALVRRLRLQSLHQQPFRLPLGPDPRLALPLRAAADEERQDGQSADGEDPTPRPHGLHSTERGANFPPTPG